MVDWVSIVDEFAALFAEDQLSGLAAVETLPSKGYDLENLFTQAFGYTSRQHAFESQTGYSIFSESKVPCIRFGNGYVLLRAVPCNADRLGNFKRAAARAGAMTVRSGLCEHAYSDSLTIWLSQVFVELANTKYINEADGFRYIRGVVGASLDAARRISDRIVHSEQEKETGTADRGIRIENFQGIFGSVSGSTVAQNLRLSVQQNDLHSLQTALAQVGIGNPEFQELKEAIASDGRRLSQNKFGEGVSSWFGRMMARAASGTVPGGIEAPAKIIPSALAQYYGVH